MKGLAALFKTLITLATLVTSVETILRLSRFAWNLVLELTRRTQSAARFARTVGGFAWGRR
jgi:carbon starvation protein CstA